MNTTARLADLRAELPTPPAPTTEQTPTVSLIQEDTHVVSEPETDASTPEVPSTDIPLDEAQTSSTETIPEKIPAAGTVQKNPDGSYAVALASGEWKEIAKA